MQADELSPGLERIAQHDHQADDYDRDPARSRQGRNRDPRHDYQGSDHDQPKTHESPREIASDVVGGAAAAHAGHGERQLDSYLGRARARHWGRTSVRDSTADMRTYQGVVKADLGLNFVQARLFGR